MKNLAAEYIRALWQRQSGVVGIDLQKPVIHTECVLRFAAEKEVAMSATGQPPRMQTMSHILQNPQFSDTKWQGRYPQKDGSEVRSGSWGLEKCHIIWKRDIFGADD